MKNWSFVAMEHYGLILNRTYLISIKEGKIEGKICRGLTAAHVTFGDPLTKYATGILAVSGDLENSRSYIEKKKLKQTSSANFSIPLSEIKSVEFNPNRKLGMGDYPHDGRVFIEVFRKKREFIILGNQNGKVIADRLRSASALEG
ncbi:hypothetical protein FHS09_000733 [Microbulbifer rhizosphaerae]|uniref:Uncharacterized protein n=2 Tax=Microbulbifer rhizosphaerae TaxID=1562603 RepID=A0A7W4Z969_9GAMM|nr:hypothetical protein [Microbulbifer rhizosphaerae]